MKFRCSDCGYVKTVEPTTASMIGTTTCPECFKQLGECRVMETWSTRKVKHNTDPHLKNRLYLARALKKGVKVYLESWDEHACKYEKDLESCITAAFLHGQVDPQLSRIFYLAVQGWWNDAVAWADYVLKEVDNV